MTDARPASEGWAPGREGFLYERIGRHYGQGRRPDPRIAARIEGALAGARRVVNVGAGAGSYEPRGRAVVAVEPSPTMIAWRAPEAAPALRARAERLPFADGAFDAALAVLTLHHWSDRAAGLAEMRRVAPRRVVLTFEPALQTALWFVAEYVPESVALDAERAPSVAEIADALGGSVRVETVPVPHDCEDGFLGAWWRRPEAYCRDAVWENISSLAVQPAAVRRRAQERLREDLASGRWRARFGHLLAEDELDLGYRLVIAEG